MKVAIYARYSSDRQRSVSIDDQVRVCRRFAEGRGWMVEDDLVFRDDAESGAARESRAGYLQLMNAAEVRAVDAILVEDQSRLWRNQAEMHAALRRLRFWRIPVIAASAGIDLTDPTGKLLASVLGWKDETYLEDLRSKTRRGLEGQVLRGMSPGGRAYGYRSVPVADPGRADAYGNPTVVGYRRVVFEPEAEIVREIFRRNSDGETPEEIAKDLNRRGVAPPRSRKGRPTRGWCPSAIRGSKRLGTGILRNPRYIGQEIWNRFHWERNPDTEAEVPRLNPPAEWIVMERPELRIVPQDLWVQARAREAEVESRTQGRYNWRARKPRYLFSGMMHCGVCGASYILVSATSYGCAFHHKRGEAICPNGLRVRRDIIEAKLLECIREEIYSAEAIAFLTSEINRQLARKQRQVTAARDSVQARLREGEARLERLEAERENVKAAIRKGLDTNLTKEALEELERERGDLIQGLGLLRSQGEEASPGERARALLSALPSVAERCLQDLPRLLARDVPKARRLIRELL